MAQDTIDIASFAVEAATSIADLKSNISELKKELSGLTIGTDDYKKALTTLEENQAALRNAMHGTATTMEQIAAAAKGTDESYNGLVRRMAMLKEELRATDISTTEGAQKFARLAGQINETNEKLKLLDKMQGNYQRNVGNYKSALDGLKNSFGAMGGAASSCVSSLTGVTNGFKALSATPALAVLGLLANAIGKVVEGLKSSEENTDKWNKALAAFKPIGDAATRTIQAIGGAIADTANWIVDLLDKWGLLTAEMSNRQALESNAQGIRDLARQTMIGNARLQAEADDLRDKAADKEKYNAQQRLKFLKDAQFLEKTISRNNIEIAKARLEQLRAEAALTENSTETNEKLVQAEVELINLQSAASRANRNYQREINRVSKEAANARKTAAKEEIQTEKAKLVTWQDLQKKIADADKRRAEEQAETDKMLSDASAELTASIQADLDAQLEAEWDAAQEEKRIQQQRIATFTAFGGAISDIANSIADIYEADGEADEKAAKKAKQLRTAGAIISTLSGAVSAFTSTWAAAELPYTAKAILAPLNAAAVIAAGMAQVKKINAVKVGSGGDTGATAIASAPAYAPAIQMTRSVTGRTEVERLNRMAGDSRVYLVYSDLEIANTRQRVRVQETEF